MVYRKHMQRQFVLATDAAPILIGAQQPLFRLQVGGMQQLQVGARLWFGSDERRPVFPAAAVAVVKRYLQLVLSIRAGLLELSRN